VEDETATTDIGAEDLPPQVHREVNDTLKLVLALAVAGVAWQLTRSRAPAPKAKPLIVFFHGKGNSTETYKPILDSLGYEYVTPHGYSVGGGRYEWWSLPSSTSDQDRLADEVDAAVDKVVVELQTYRNRRLVLAGHSQGGQLAAALAMRSVAPAVVAAAWVPEVLRTLHPSPIVFVHGTEDTTVPFERTQEMVEDLHFHDVPQVRLVSVQGAGHGFSGALLDVWKQELRKVAG
jgi:predicted esterase